MKHLNQSDQFDLQVIQVKSLLLTDKKMEGGWERNGACYLFLMNCIAHVNGNKQFGFGLFPGLEGEPSSKHVGLRVEHLPLLILLPLLRRRSDHLFFISSDPSRLLVLSILNTLSMCVCVCDEGHRGSLLCSEKRRCILEHTHGFHSLNIHLSIYTHILGIRPPVTGRAQKAYAPLHHHRALCVCACVCLSVRSH